MRETMRRAWFAIGLAFVLLGIILAANAQQTVLEDKIESVKLASVTAESSVSANMQKGDKMVVEIRSGVDWPDDPLEVDEHLYPGYGILVVTLNITDPTGNATTYDIIYGRLEDRRAVAFLNITITHQGGLNTTGLYKKELNMYEGIGGVTMYSGTYTVTVPQNWIYPPKESPPAALEIYKGTIVKATKYPYMYYLPSGMVLGAVGVVASVLALRSPKRVIRSKSRKGTNLSRKNAG
jgi:hypothetical protein